MLYVFPLAIKLLSGWADVWNFVFEKKCIHNREFVFEIECIFFRFFFLKLWFDKYNKEIFLNKCIYFGVLHMSRGMFIIHLLQIKFTCIHTQHSARNNVGSFLTHRMSATPQLINKFVYGVEL